MADDDRPLPDDLLPDDAPPPEPPTAEELEALRARALEADELEDRLKRAQADFVNEGRRIQRQAEQERRYANEGLLKDLVHVVEHLDQALKAAAGASDASALRAGVELVVKETEAVLKKHGAEVLRPTGVAFDPLQHEALAMVPHATLPPGHVADVLSPGLALHGRVLRAARVTVVKPAPPAPAPLAPPEA